MIISIEKPEAAPSRFELARREIESDLRDMLARGAGYYEIRIEGMKAYYIRAKVAEIGKMIVKAALKAKRLELKEKYGDGYTRTDLSSLNVRIFEPHIDKNTGRVYVAAEPGRLTDALAAMEAAAGQQDRGPEADIDGRSIIELNLTAHTYNCLMRSGIRTVGELRRAVASGGLNGVRNLGPKSAEECQEAIETAGGMEG